MSAIEQCRSLALGATCCAVRRAPNRRSPITRAATALPEVPEQRRAALARSAAGRPLAGCVLPRRVHLASADQRHRLHQQGDTLWTVVRHRCRDAAHDRRRSEALGCPDRYHPGAAHVGLGPDSHPHVLASCRRRPRGRCRAVGAVQAGLLSSRSGCSRGCSGAASSKSCRTRNRCRSTQVLRRAHRFSRRRCLRRLASCRASM